MLFTENMKYHLYSMSMYLYSIYIQYCMSKIYTAQNFIQNIFVILINVDHDEYLKNILK